MRYDDASGAFQNSAAGAPDARDDTDALAAGSRGPATGNVITGAGTVSGKAGADTAAGAEITAVHGAGGSDSDGSLEVAGRYGKLTIDRDGDYSYVRNAGGADGVSDVFRYTLGEGANQDMARLTINIGREPLKVDASAQQIVPGPDGVVTLPPGVELSDVHVVGRNLVIDMPDGTQMVIVDGAVFVPQLVLGGVEVPATNLAALLIDSEPQPAAGPQLLSSGGNFAVDVPPLDPGVPLGDLIPPTEFGYTPPTFEEVGVLEDEEPTIIIDPDDQPAAVNASDVVNEAGLPTRNGGEPEGSGEELAAGANGDTRETTAGTIFYEADDGLESVTINGIVVTGVVGQVIPGTHGDMVITSVADGTIGYSYTLTDNTIGDDTSDFFTVTVTDEDGDEATGTLTIDIIDDVPIPRNDTDAVTNQQPTTTGNVMTGVDTTSGEAGRDTVGADNATLTAVSGAGGSDSSFDESGNLVVTGSLGTLTIKADGSYSYTANNNSPGGTDVFTYSLTDGDGDVRTATLTITVPADQKPTVTVPTSGAGTVVDEKGLPERDGDLPDEPAGSGEIADGDGTNNSDGSETTTGTITFTQGDPPATVTIDGLGAGGPVTITEAGQTIIGQYGTLTITSYNAATGQIGYSYTLADNTSGNNTEDNFTVVVTDVDGDTATATLSIDIIDDVPTARPDIDVVPSGSYAAVSGNVITDASAGDEGDTDTDASDIVGADDAVVVGVAAGDTGANLEDADTVGTVIQGDYGKLTLNADGSYTYVRDAGTPGGVTDVFTYTLEDGDGDYSSTTLTIIIEDRTVRVGENPDVLTDDDAVPLAGGNPGGPEDDADAANLTGTLSGAGTGDGPLTFDLLTTGAPDGFTYVDGPDGSILVQQVQDGSTVTVLTITVDATTGDYTVTQNAPIRHPSLDDQEGDDTENNVEFTINYTVTDQDDDVGNGTLTINVDDDTPELSGQTINDDVVDEDGLGNAGGVNDVPGAELTAGGNVSGLFLAGADKPLTYSLSTDTLNLPQLTSNDVPVTYAVTSAVVEGVVIYTLTATAGEEPIFELTLNSETGDYTFTLQGALDHDSLDGEEGDDTENPDASDLYLQLGAFIRATDADGDTITAPANALVVKVDDDTPEDFEPCPDPVSITNEPGLSVEDIALNLPDVGADEPGVVSFGVENGDPVLDSEGNPVFSNGLALKYYVNELDPTILEARTSVDADPVFTIDLDVENNNYDFHLIGDITNEVDQSIDVLSSIGGGNVEAKGIDTGTQFDLILSTKPGDTINTSANWIGASTGQSVEGEDAVRIDFVQNVFTTGSGGGAVLNFGEYYSVNSFRQDVGGLNNVQFASFTVTAFNITEVQADSAFYGDPDAIVANTTLQIYDASGNLITDFDAYNALNGDDPDLVVTDNGDGTWTVTGLPNGFDYEISSSTSFEAVQVDALADTDTFKLGVIDLTRVEQVPVEILVPIILTDADGDSVSCDIEIDLTPGVAVAAETATLDDDGLANANALAGAGDIDANLNDENAGEPGDTEAVFKGTLTGTGGTGDLDFTLVAPVGSVTVGQETVTMAVVGGVLTATIATSPDDSRVGLTLFTVALDSESGEYTVTLARNVLHDTDASNDEDGNDLSIAIGFKAEDEADGVATGSLKIVFNDDVPTAKADADKVESGASTAEGNVISGSGTTAGTGNADVGGADQLPKVTQVSFTDPTNNDPNTNTTTVLVPAVGSTTIEGNFGTLTISANGTYSYERADGTPGDAEDVFTYTLTDADGDTSTSTLTITIEDSGVTVSIPTAVGDTWVYETALGTAPQGLSEASNLADPNNDTREFVDGTITFTAPDGLGAITIGTESIEFGPGATFPQTVVDDSTGTLVITAVTYDPVTGEGSISYEYTLKNNTLGDQAVNGGDTNILFPVDIEDADGDHSPAGNLEIRIVDDAIDARDDSASVAEGGSVNGSVLTNDLSGADDYGVKKVVGGVVGNDPNTDTQNMAGTELVLDGDYGTLTLRADGSYTYVADANIPLPADFEDQFVYTVRDGDGDLDSAVLTITVNDITLTPDNRDLDVYEAALDTVQDAGDLAPAGVNGSTNTSSPNESVSGTLSVTGAVSYTLQGTGVGTHGVISINSTTGEFTYTLTAPVDGSTSDNGPNEFNDVETFTYVATDANGNTVEGTIKIDVIDDVPTARADTDTLNTGTKIADGNVITGVDTIEGTANADTKGADGAEVTGLVGYGGSTDSRTFGDAGDGSVQVNGQWGVLSIAADGTYTYTRNDGTPGGGQETFTYTLTDGDGDTSTTTLKITLPNSPPTITVTDELPEEAADDQVFEKGLPVRGMESEGSGEAADPDPLTDQSEITTGTATFTSIDGVQSITITPIGGGAPLVLTEAQLIALGTTPQTITGTGYTLQLNSYSYDPATGQGTLGYTFTLTDNTLGDQAVNGGDTAFAFTVEIKDDDNQTGSDTLTVKVVDDNPTANNDTAREVAEDGSSINGNVMTNDVKGADGAVVTHINFGSGWVAITSGALQGDGSYLFNETEGTYTIKSDGSWTFDPNVNLPNGVTALDASFSYRITDGDNDVSEAVQPITVTDGAIPGAGGNVALTLLEPALDLTQNGSDLAAGTSTGTNPGSTGETQVVAPASGLHFTAGSDAITSVAFSLSSAPIVSGLAPGFSIEWSINMSGQLVGTLMEGATNHGVAIIVQLTGETGTTAAGDTADVGVTATLVGRLEHVNPPATQGDVTITGIQVVASQADGDSNTGTVSLTVTDDAPTSVSPEAASVTNDASGFDTGALDFGDANGITNNVGADGGFARFASSGYPTLTSGGVTVVYTLSNNGQTLTATKGEGGPVVFTATISGSSYSIDMNLPLDSLQNVDLNPLSAGFVGGNDPWAGFILPSSGDLLLTPTSESGTLASDGNTVNTSNILLGIGTGQAVDDEEGLRIDFVNNLSGNTAKTDNGGYSDVDNRDHSFDSHYTTNGASVKMTQENGLVTVAFKAYDDNSADIIVGDGTQEAITGISIEYLGVLYVNPITNSSIIVPTTTPTDYTVNGRIFTVELADDGKTVFVTGIEGDNGNSGAGTEIAVFTGNGYTSLEVINASADEDASFKISNIGAAVVTTNPVQFNLPVQIVDNDGDVSATTNIAVTATTPPSSSSSSTTMMVSREAVNDNGDQLLASDSFEQQKSYANNSVLLGAIAAAGLAGIEPLVAIEPTMDFDALTQSVDSGSSLDASAVEAASVSETSAELITSAFSSDLEADPALESSSSSGSEKGGSNVDGDADVVETETASFGQGVDALDASATALSTITADAVAMPSAEMIAATLGDVEGAPQKTGEVGRVIADALAGGADGPNIDAVIDAVADHAAGTPAAADGLASLAQVSVPVWDTGALAAFHGSQSAFNTDAMQFHQDAVQPAA